MKARKILSAVLLSCSFGFGLVAPVVSPAFAGSNYRDGMQMMQARQYARAVASFEQALRENPRDQNSYYCLGTCYYNMKDLNNAKSYYLSAVQISANSPTGLAAKQALKGLEQQAQKSGANPVRTISNTTSTQSRSVSSGTTSNTATNSTAGTGTMRRSRATQEEDEPTGDISSLPTNTRVRFYRRGSDHLFVDAYVNNRSIPVIFDTGAESCAFGFNHLAQLGIPNPTTKPTGMAIGVGSAGAQPTWTVRTTVKIGNIERKNFPITVQKNLPTDPLLGQNFFKAFHYTVETDSNPETGAIHFTRSGGQSAGSIYKQRESNAEVPFTREGREMVVSVLINGKPTQMYFDTGAAGVVLSKSIAKAINLPIPDDAEEGYRGGVSGDTKSLNFPVRSIKMGPIEKTNFQVSVIEELGVKKGLLGQSFFGDWRYTIDTTNNVIKFKR